MINLKKLSVVILADNRGLRIKKKTKFITKPLVKFKNVPLLTLILNNISKYNFKKIFVLVECNSSQILKKYNNKFFHFNKIKCIKVKKRQGTFGAIVNIRKKLTKNFFVINCDTIFDANFNILQKYDLKRKLVMFVSKEHNFKENKKINRSGVKKSFSKTQKKKYINSGIYLLSKKIFSKKNLKKKSLENDIIPELMSKREIKRYIEHKSFIDIGTNKKLISAKNSIKNLFNRPAVFLDRDGVINHDFGYVHKFDNFKFRYNVIKALRFLNKKKINIFIVTNQAGIAKGYYTKKDFYKLHIKIKDYLIKKNIYLSDVKFSPFHPNGIIKKYLINSSYRKPGNLMIKKLFRDWIINKKKSFMIGDQISDKQAAYRSNLYFEYVDKNIYKQIKKICIKLKI